MDLTIKKYHKHILLLREEETRKSLILKYRIMKLDESCLKLNHIDILRSEIDEQKIKVLSKMSAKIKLIRDCFNKVYGSANAGTFNPDRFLQPFVFVRTNKEIIL
jgi:hypothetical protein